MLECSKGRVHKRFFWTCKNAEIIEVRGFQSSSPQLHHLNIKAVDFSTAFLFLKSLKFRIFVCPTLLPYTRKMTAAKMYRTRSHNSILSDLQLVPYIALPHNLVG